MNAKDTIEIQIGFGMDLKADDTLQMLGVVPKDGLCELGLYDIPNRDLFYNIERTFGTYVNSVLTKSVSDCWGLDIYISRVLLTSELTERMGRSFMYAHYLPWHLHSTQLMQPNSLVMMTSIL